MKKIAIFASGRGSNARKIIEYFEGNENVDVRLIVSNKKNAGVLEMGPEFVIPTKICLLYTSPSPRDQRGSRMPSSA